MSDNVQELVDTIEYYVSPVQGCDCEYCERRDRALEYFQSLTTENARLRERVGELEEALHAIIKIAGTPPVDRLILERAEQALTGDGGKRE